MGVVRYVVEGIVRGVVASVEEIAVDVLQGGVDEVSWWFGREVDEVRLFPNFTLLSGEDFSEGGTCCFWSCCGCFDCCRDVMSHVREFDCC